MGIKKLSNDLSVAEQIYPTDISQIAELGFKTILCNRPDGEVADQPSVASIMHEAPAAGIMLKYQPVSPRVVTDEDAADFHANLQKLEAPVLAYCRSGTRCAILWALAEGIKGSPVEEVIGATANAGYNLAPLAARVMALKS